MSNSQTSIRSALESLGYELTDNGNHWRSRAVYRDGDNPTSLLIYKDSGVWIDYVKSPDKPFPFKVLIELSGGEVKEENLDFSKHEKKEDLMTKIYPDKMLERLLPYFDFYKKKCISEKTQKLYKCGYATAGKLFRRIVFPIYNRHKQIIGFSGRSIYEDNTIKWKHLGQKRNWAYPTWLHEDFKNSIINNGEAILIESVGDSMALTEQGFLNNMVMFGLSQLSSTLSTLVELAPSRVVISLNNDKFSSKDKAYASIAMCKLYFRLLNYFDADQIEVRKPILGDFGEMQEHEDRDELFKKWSSQKFDIKKQTEEWHNLNKQYSCFSKDVSKKLETIISKQN